MAYIKQGYKNVNDISMYYEIHGNEGAFLVLLHGGGSTIETSFGKILPALARQQQVIAVELQGHGHTSDRDAEQRFEQDADDVAALLKMLEIKKASVLGYSNAGNTAMQIAIRHPQVIEKLIVASGFYKKNGLPAGFFEGMQHAGIDVMPKELKDAFMDIQHDETKLHTMFLKDKARMLAFEDWDDSMLENIQAPTLVMAGDRDVVLPEHSVKLADLLHARLMILPSNHGGYIGAVESDMDDNNMVEYTANVICRFLQHQEGFH